MGDTIDIIKRLNSIKDFNQYLELLKEEDFVNQILKHYEFVIQIFMQKYNIPYYEQEDVLQEGRLAIYRALTTFEPEKGSKLESYISLCVERTIITYVRDKNRKKRRHDLYNQSLDTLSGLSLHEKVESHINVEEEVITTMYFREIIDEVNQELLPLEAKLYGKYVEGYSIQELSDLFQLPKKKIYMIIAKARKKIQDKLSHS